jgi:O-antigen/teichoic acid export membrane protein
VALALTVTCSLFAAITLGLGVLGVLLGALVAELLMLPVRIATARHMLGPYFSPAVLRGLLAFGIPLVPASLAYWIFTTFDRILLGNLSSLAEVGLYNVAAALVGVTSIAVTALGQAWSPHAILAYEADTDSARRLFGRMLTYILATFGTLAVGLSAFAHEIVDATTADEYAGAAMGVAPLAIGVVAYASTQVTAGGISLMKRTTYLAVYSWLAAIVNVVLCLILIPPYGMLGAAWATAAAYIVLTLAYLVTSHRLWPIAYERRRSLTTVALTLLFIGGTFLLPLPPPNLESGLVLDVAFKALYCLAFVGALLATRALDTRDVALIRRMLEPRR